MLVRESEIRGSRPRLLLIVQQLPSPKLNRSEKPILWAQGTPYDQQ